MVLYSTIWCFNLKKIKVYVKRESPKPPSPLSLPKWSKKEVRKTSTCNVQNRPHEAIVNPSNFREKTKLANNFITTVFVDRQLWKTKHPLKRFQNFPQSCVLSTDRIEIHHSPLPWRKEGQNVTLVAVIGGFRSDLSITRKTDENFGDVSAGVG